MANSTFFWIISATIIDSLLGLIGKLTFAIKEKVFNRLLIHFISFSAGALLGGAFFHLLPESLEKISPMAVFSMTTIGFILFVLIEAYFHWNQGEECTIHPFSYVMLVGDGVHNFIDGLVIAASFFVNFNLGIITTLMIMFHEIPQELGLFGSLVYAGHKKNKSLLYSFLAQSTVILGGIIGFLLARQIQIMSSFLIAFAAGGFLYIAAADLVPEVHKAYHGDLKKSLLLLATLIVGILFMVGLKLVEN